MRMSLFVVLLVALPAGAQEMARSDWHLVSHLGGWALSPDTMTVIVAETPRGELVLFDVTGEKDPRRVEVEFKPTALAVQGNNLFAAAEGSGIVHVLSLPDFKESKQVNIPGGAVQRLACHPTKGMVYAVLTDNKIVAIDPGTMTATLTSAKGQSLAVDPHDPYLVYVGMNFSSQDVMDFMKIGDNKTRVEFLRVTPTAILSKYRAEGKTLKLIRGIGNASVGHKGEIAVSPDGRSVTLVSPGGWWDLQNNKKLYDIAFFQTSDMKTVLGSLNHGAPRSVAFHPDLDFLAALGQGGLTSQGHAGQVTLFRRTSLKEEARYSFPHYGPANDRVLRPRATNPSQAVDAITFAAKGTRLVLIAAGTVQFVELDLSDQQRESLRSKYGVLPSRKPSTSQDASSPALAKAVNLLEGIDVKRDSVWGEWSIREAKLNAPAEGRLRLRAPSLPEEYAITLTAERLDKNGGLGLSLPVGVGRMFVGADFGFGNNTVGGLGFLEARKVFDTPGAQWARQVFVLEKSATLLVLVRKTGVVVAADNKKLLDWKGDPSKFHVAPEPNSDFHNQHERWYFPPRPGIYLYTNGPFRISQIEVGPIPEQIALAEPDADKPGPPPLGGSNPRGGVGRGTGTRGSTPSGAWSHLKPGNFTVNAGGGHVSNRVGHNTPQPRDCLSTREDYSGPLEIKATVRLPEGKGDLRVIAYQTALMIVCPTHSEGIGVHIRRPGADKLYSGSPLNVGPTPVSFKDWTTLRWRLTEQGMALYINDQLVLVEHGPLSLDAASPVSLCGCLSRLDVKALEVKKLEAGDKPQLPTDKTPGRWDHLHPANYKVAGDFIRNSFRMPGPTPAPTLAVGTKESFVGPIEINAVLRLTTGSKADIRLFAFRSGLLIFNPHLMNAPGKLLSIAFRLPDATEAYAGTEVKPAPCPSDFKDWTKVTWRITESAMTVLVNDQQFYHVDKAFDLSVGGPVRVGGYNGSIDIKSLEVKPLK